MPYSLKGRNVLITGGSRGLGALVANKFAAEGSNVAINYVSNKETADQVASDIASKYGVKTIVVQGDAGSQAECTNAVKTTIEQLGGLDVVISNAGWTKMVNFADLDAMDDADWDKCWNVNVKSSFYLFKAALPTFNANPEGGAFIITSSTAGVTPSGSSLPYAVTKGAVIHLMKCLAQTQGPKVRVNAVLPGLLLTEWGQRFSSDKIEGWKGRTALKRLPEVEDTADLYIATAKNSSMTGQAVQIDSGFTFK
ncbi:Short-chain dehydrogenase/reductase SDR [Penicillium cinerascens]|uniref:Short-chain dehydrogenase/reductase SDR n=1 Tax=Penicillium cinerascens TaxID=70096 RepID=A0A9W9MA94_9EURO|nr:Short-chain dehydrogenase/reductase SDR [Penicillium cinerascens]KAJ5195070.1 Short-chain dehydrogenase/reductase SDR [Penicillium cinerascens]